MSGTRKLGRATDCRRAMLRAMVTYLLEKGQIETTVTRAKVSSQKIIRKRGFHNYFAQWQYH